MELTSVRNIFRDREQYMGKEVSIGGWVRSIRASKTFGCIVVNDGTFFEPRRWFIVMHWQILRKYQN